jgi:hypothetical protein
MEDKRKAMNVKFEIDSYSKEEDKPVLLNLFKKYHTESNWHFVAKCKFEGPYPSYRVWTPTIEGKILYNYYKETE